MRRFVLGLVILFAGLSPALALAQLRSTGLISDEVAHRHGLRRAWNTQIEVNRGNGRVVNVVQFVSRTQKHLVYEVADGDRLYLFSERDRNAFGEVLGPAGAKAVATDKFYELTAAKKTPTAREHVVPAVFLYATTSRGVVHALDGETGKTLWTKQVGNLNFPMTAAAANDQHVAVCNGSNLYLLAASDGQILWERRAVGAVSTGPAMTADLIAVPMVSGIIEGYKPDQQVRGTPTTYRSQGNIFVPPIATPSSVAWTTNRGHLYVADGSSGQPRFRLEASDTIIGGAAFLAPGYFFVGSFDGYVYCVDEQDGAQRWRYQTGSTISKTPVAIGETVYMVTDTGELHALDYLTGQLKELKASHQAAAAASVDTRSKQTWPIVTGIRGIVSASPSKLYCLGRSGELVVLDAQGGRRLGTLPIGNQDLILQNHETDRLILGTTTGQLQCFHERQRGWPNGPYVHAVEWEKIHGVTPKATPEKAPATSETAPPPTMPPTTPLPMNNTGDDPFGGGGNAAPMPPPGNTPPAEAADPFG